MANQVIPFRQVRTARVAAPLVVRCSRVIVMIGSQRYAIDVSAVATPLRAQPAALQILERKPDRRV
jgi:hypothetical protein